LFSERLLSDLYSAERIMDAGKFELGFLALPETLSFLGRLNNVQEVYLNDFQVSTSALVSFGYRFCSAVIMKSKVGGTSRGLSHVISGDEPKNIIDGLINKLGERPADLFAFVVDCIPSKRIQKYCAQIGLEISDEYHGPRNGYPAFQRDIVVLPEQERVLVYVEGHDCIERKF